MAWYTWLIIGLIVLSWAQYTYPEKTKFVGTVFDPVNEFLNKKTPVKTPENDVCPDTNEPVCGSNGVTYGNICKAAMADILEVTQGAC